MAGFLISESPQARPVAFPTVVPPAHAGLTGSGQCWHFASVMSVTVQLNLPDALVREAKASGLLRPESISDLLAAELRRRKAALELNKVLNDVHAQSGEPMSEEEIQAEVNAVRAGKRARREAGR
jgi:hypothetical protein